MLRFSFSLCLLVVAGRSAQAAPSCGTLFSGGRIEQTIRDAFLPQGRTGAHAKLFETAPSPVDFDMMRASYLQRTKAGPVEIGRVELLDRDGKVMATTDFVSGANTKIRDLNEVAIELLELHSDQAPQIATVRIGHTHPQQLHPAMQNTRAILKTYGDRFSPQDTFSDARMRLRLDESRAFRHVQFESFIVFIDPKHEWITSWRTSEDFQPITRIFARRFGPWIEHAH